MTDHTPTRELSLWRCGACFASVCIDSSNRALCRLRAVISSAPSTLDLLFGDGTPTPEAVVVSALDLKSVMCPCCGHTATRVAPAELAGILAAGKQAYEDGALPDMGVE